MQILVVLWNFGFMNQVLTLHGLNAHLKAVASTASAVVGGGRGLPRALGLAFRDFIGLIVL